MKQSSFKPINQVLDSGLIVAKSVWYSARRLQLLALK
jgi:hypothetical protein